ncbi:MAG: glycoside hydrolase family 2 TIM barrel-domain containing protein, partial [Candidatus Lokiarchaeia archaeon]
MKTVSLNGKWKCKADVENNGIKNKWYDLESYNARDSHLIDIEIPKSFNLLKGFENFEGIFWHFNQFELNKEKDINKYDYQIRFKGSNYNTKIWMNGEFLGEHNGGFTPFFLDISNLIKTGNNNLVVRTNNIRKKDQIPSMSFDWFNWGGIYRDVDLLILHKNRVKDIFIKTKLRTRQESKIEISYSIIGEVSLKWQILDSSKTDILYEGTSPDRSGKGSFNLTINDPKLWSPNAPNLYYLKFFDNSQKTEDLLIFNTHFGIRQIEINGIHIYLNKEKIFLKGASLHEEYMPYGRTIPYKKRKEDIENFKSLGFNAIRTAHYSHDEALIEITDKIGLLVLEEIPVYQHCDFKNSQTYETAKNMLKELIYRDINHPSVIWWSVGNEVPLHQRNCARFIKKLIEFARELDDTRIITCVSRKLIYDLTRKYIDVATINSYFGWYYGHEKMISLILDIIRTPVHNKPWIYTEFGAGAKYGFHVDWNKQKKYSEEKQLQVLDYTIRTINSKEFIAGWFIWNYRDFKSIKRTNKFQEGFNRKGLVSGEKNEKKLVYYRIPKIINVKRKTFNTKIAGIILWIVLFPLSFFL